MQSLSDKVTAALQEVRILILGSQILLGFQFNAVFQPKFSQLPEATRALDCVAYGLMLSAAILFLLPGSFHRLAEGGDDTLRLQRLTTSVAAIAMLPFGICLGIDEYIVAAKILGEPLAVAAGLLLAAAAFAAWYVIELIRRERKPRGQDGEEIVRTSIKEKIRTLGTEIRVVLPGAQALLGFQFAAFLSDAFERLPDMSKAVHFASVTTMAVAVVLLMAPAAFNRIAAGGDDTKEVDLFGTYAMLGAMVLVALSMTGDFYVILMMVSGVPALAMACPIAALCITLALWVGFPLAARRGVRSIVEPIGQGAAHAFRCGDVAMHDQAVGASGEVFGIGPAGEFDLLGLGDIFTRSRCRIGIATIGTNQAIDHELQAARHLIPIDGGGDEDAVRGHPFRVDLIHPIVSLAKAVIRIAAARPVTERHGRRDAGLARMNLAAVFR